MFAALGDGSSALASGGGQTPDSNADGELVVRGNRDPNGILVGLTPESELDENGIAAYGQDTVGDILAEIANQVGNSRDGPIILINGQPSNGIDEVADLPSEALSRIQILPRQAAGRLGENPARRVVNIVIKPDLRQVTGNVTAGLATAGEGGNASAEVNLLSLDHGDRRSFVLKASHTDPLFEGDRALRSEVDGIPHDFTGNVASYPVAGSNIDPALSLLVGHPVLVAGVPAGTSNPTLANFAARADRANISDLGGYRTLLARLQVVGGSANLTHKIGKQSQLSLVLTAERSETRNFTGATAVDLRLPAATPFSPFSNDVLVLRYLGGPLAQGGDQTALGVAGNLNTKAGRWRITLSAQFAHRVGHTQSDRGIDTSALLAGVAAGSINPFAALPSGPMLIDRARSRSDSGSTQLLVNGAPFSLPAGPVNLALRLEWRGSRTNSETIGGVTSFASILHRDEESVRLVLQLPFVAPSSPLGSVGIEFSGALRHVTAAGGLEDYGYALNWEPSPTVSFRATINREQIAPSPNSLTDPVITLDGVRTFDFIRQETVLVRYVTGGNPALGVERRKTTQVTATITPFSSADFTLNAEYLNVDERDAFSPLPPVNAEVQAAFPDRFQRDPAGRLIAVDARLVSFARVRREQLRWGASLSRSLGRAAPANGAAKGGGDNVLGSRWRINGFFDHTWTISSTRLARAGLPEVDLLAGGAPGYGGGELRHQVQFGAGAAHNGVGLQLRGDWKGTSRIDSGTIAAPDQIVFAPRLMLGARLFANLGPLVPGSSLAKGTRVTVAVDNLLDSKQRVTGSSGATPIRYQPYLLDPLGRTISLSLRKVF